MNWLIIGGGIHGVHLAVRLIAEAGVSASAVRILDPAEHLLARWRAATQMTGMVHLRSPAVHHLDLTAVSLQRFAGKRSRRKPKCFAPPYDRPSLELFNAHCDWVLETYGLRELHIRGRAETCTVDGDALTVGTAGGRELRAGRVVLAMGASEELRWPSWAPRSNPRVQHMFDPCAGTSLPSEPERIAVVGGGVSAAQLALRLVHEQHCVHLVSRHPLREHQFDSDPGWLGPKFMAGFAKEPAVHRRRSMVTAARHRGSVPPDVRRALRRATEAGTLAWRETEVQDVVETGRALSLNLCGGEEVEVDRIFLATGFEGRRPGGPMIDTLIKRAALPCAPCGYPIVDGALRWHPLIYVTGPLAELELGPVARNIAGARRAGDRLVQALRNGTDATATGRPKASGSTHDSMYGYV